MFQKSKKTPTTLLNQTEIMTIIGEDFELIGNINSNSLIRIEGKVTGDIHVQKGIILGTKAVVKGNIETDAAVIYGTIYGNIKVKQLEIKQTGIINGDIKTEVFGVEMGAQYNGKLEMKNQGVTKTESKPMQKMDKKEEVTKRDV